MEGKVRGNHNMNEQQWESPHERSMRMPRNSNNKRSNDEKNCVELFSRSCKTAESQTCFETAVDVMIEWERMEVLPMPFGAVTRIRIELAESSWHISLAIVANWSISSSRPTTIGSCTARLHYFEFIERQRARLCKYQQNVTQRLRLTIRRHYRRSIALLYVVTTASSRRRNFQGTLVVVTTTCTRHHEPLRCRHRRDLNNKKTQRTTVLYYKGMSSTFLRN